MWEMAIHFDTPEIVTEYKFSETLNSTASYTMSSPNIMTSTMTSADTSQWDNQNLHFQTAANNYSRVDFRFTSTDLPRFSVALAKEDFGSVGKQILSAKPHYGIGNSTYFQIHNNASTPGGTYTEDGTNTWNNVGNYHISNGTVCSIITSSFWDENPFGTSPSNIGISEFGYITLNTNNYGMAFEWGVDPSDGNVVFTVWFRDPANFNNLYTAYVKLTKAGDFVNVKYYGDHVSFNNLTDLLDRYALATEMSNFSITFSKDAAFPQPTLVKSIVDGTLVHTESTDYTGSYYITAIINGIGQIEFLPNPYMYFAPETIYQSNIQTAVNAWILDPTAAEQQYGHISTWDVSQVTNMDSLFELKQSFNDDISGWDVSNVTSMVAMFQVANAFNQPIGGWDVSQVTNMERMFYYDYAFNQDISNWDVSQVTNMYKMFDSAPGFNQPLNTWNVTNLTTMEGMFMNATGFNQNISNWDVSNVPDANFSGYGTGASSHSDSSFTSSSKLYFTN
jgi:surface protein